MSFEFDAAGLLVLRAAILVAVFAAFTWALLSSRRDAANQFAALRAQHDAALTEIHRLAHRLIEIAGAIGSLEEKLRPEPVATRPTAPPPPQPVHAPSGARGYDMAIRMARSGASVEEIVSSCGTTRAEARLLRRLHCAADGASAA